VHLGGLVEDARVVIAARVRRELIEPPCQGADQAPRGAGREAIEVGPKVEFDERVAHGGDVEGAELASLEAAERQELLRVVDRRPTGPGFVDDELELGTWCPSPVSASFPSASSHARSPSSPTLRKKSLVSPKTASRDIRPAFVTSRLL